MERILRIYLQAIPLILPIIPFILLAVFIRFTVMGKSEINKNALLSFKTVGIDFASFIIISNIASSLFDFSGRGIGYFDFRPAVILILVFVLHMFIVAPITLYFLAKTKSVIIKYIILSNCSILALFSVVQILI